MQNCILQNLGRLALSTAAIAALSLGGINPAHAQTFTVFYTFTGGTDGATPFDTPLISNNGNGNIYVTTHAGGTYSAGAVEEVNFKSRNHAVLHSFAGPPADGAGPIAGLIQDTTGNLYGATYKGGADNFGAVFELTLAGKLTLLHSFAGPPNEGSGPAATPIFDPAGDLYGTTYQGGAAKGYGTVYEITAGGAYMTGQSFPADEGLPRGGLWRQGGQIFGTSVGSSATTPMYGGTIFMVGDLTPLYKFSGGADGAQPMGGVVGDGKGNLYGTTSGGGSASFGSGNGVVYAFNTSTATETVLHTFNGSDGAVPMAGLAWDTAGNLYGTTILGGEFGYGTVFKLDTSHKLTTIYSFTGGADGGNPNGGVVVDSTGNIWGSTSNGGSAPAPGGYGTLFVISPPPAG
jgi:uncharacterized repeat protein (TIGR03803 family)